ncbi:phosphoribosylglycinamide formyltransferase [Microbacterium sp. G2-8]|uniref:phosphoribosylglycinamide formyltransferase n=1 Tax=Microbacterium sp. G2-8 TaxID=2842454 RepID=UPI001C8AAA4F|nr:phosphoribosylglycinamide formyltransferase [Microbacterium sp. G2-8]
MLNVAVLISGAGSNMRALLEAAADPAYPARVETIGSDRDADGLQHGADFGIPSFSVPYRAYETREEWGEALAEQLRAWSPDLIVLSGLMRLLPANVVSEFAPHIINTHPAYLPEFPGAHGVRDALAAGAAQTGASVIQVDDGVDTGPILAQERVAIEPGDTEQTLHARIKPVERRLLIDVVRRVATGDIDLTNPNA